MATNDDFFPLDIAERPLRFASTETNPAALVRGQLARMCERDRTATNAILATVAQARYQIVGEHEADVKKGRVSITSPIARAMIGKESGDVVEVRIPGGFKSYEITKVEWV